MISNGVYIVNCAMYIIYINYQL